jgi:hypothetical protein
VRCDCGCGFEGPDDVTQWCVEEAATLVVVAEENRQAEPELSPGEQQKLRHEQLMGRT